MELTEQIRTEVLQRQKGMCGYCGKKFDEIDAPLIEKVFICLETSKSAEQITADDYVLLCNQCYNDTGLHQNPESVTEFKKFHFNYANFSNYSLESKIEDFKIETEKMNLLSENSTDYREFRTKTKLLQNALKNMGFAKDVYEEFNNSLNNSLQAINKRQREVTQKYETEFEANYTAIKTKLDEAIQNSKDSFEFKEAREALIYLQNQVNDIQISKKQRDELLDSINIAFDDLNRRQSEEWEKYEMECSENYLNLKPKVEAAHELAINTNNFRQSRETLISVQNEFKGLKLKKEQRDELFTKIQDAFESVNKRQDEERLVFEKECSENYDKVKPIVDEAIAFANDVANFKQGRETLISAQTAIKGVKLNKEQRDDLYGIIRVCFENLNKRQTEERAEFEKECSENYATLKEKVKEAFDEVNGDPEFNALRDKLIAMQGDVKLLKLKREQRNQLFAKIREIFSILDEKRKEYRENREEVKKKKLSTIYDNLKNKILRIEDSITWDEKSLAFQKNKLETLVEDETFEEQKAVIIEKIKMIEERIQEKISKIEDTRIRISDIQKEIDSSENK